MNSTHWAIIGFCAVIIFGMYFDKDLEELAPVLAPLGIYAGVRERSRIKSKLDLVSKFEPMLKKFLEDNGTNNKEKEE